MIVTHPRYNTYTTTYTTYKASTVLIIWLLPSLRILRLTSYLHDLQYNTKIYTTYKTIRSQIYNYTSPDCTDTLAVPVYTGGEKHQIWNTQLTQCAREQSSQA